VVLLTDHEDFQLALHEPETVDTLYVTSALIFILLELILL